MGVADLCNACSDWTNIRKCRPTFSEMTLIDVADIFWCRRDGDKSRLHFSASVNRRLGGGYAGVRLPFDRSTTYVTLRYVPVRWLLHWILNKQEFVRPRWPYDMRPSVRAEKYMCVIVIR